MYLNVFSLFAVFADYNVLANSSLFIIFRCLCTKRDSIIVLIVAIGACIFISISLAFGLPQIHEKRRQYYDVSFPESPSPLLTYSKAVVVSDGVKCADIGK